MEPCVYAHANRKGARGRFGTIRLASVKLVYVGERGKIMIIPDVQ